MSQVVGFRKDRKTGKTYPIYSKSTSQTSKISPSGKAFSILTAAEKEAEKMLHSLKVVVEDVASKIYTGSKLILTELMKFIEAEAKKLGLKVKFELEKLDVLGSKGVTHPVEHLEVRKKEVQKLLQEVGLSKKK